MRPPRLAFLLNPAMEGQFADDLIAGLPALTGWDVRAFRLTTRDWVTPVRAWTDGPDDAVWCEFCWPPFPELIERGAFAGRRVIVRVHRIEAMETAHVARMAWANVDDAIVVSSDMLERVRQLAPNLERTTRLHLIHNGIDMARFTPLADWDGFRIGWCGIMTPRKNPTLALQVLHALRTEHDPRYRLRICARGRDALAGAAFNHLLKRLHLEDAVQDDGAVPYADMPAWHAGNGVLLHTSLHESFGYGIAEAAAVGCDLAVMDHPGAAEFWPEATRFGSLAEAAWLITHAAPYRWIEHIAEFSLQRQLAATAPLFASAG